MNSSAVRLRDDGWSSAWASVGVKPIPISTAVGIAAMAIAFPAGMWNLVNSGFLGAACRGPVLTRDASTSAPWVTSSAALCLPFAPFAGLVPDRSFGSPVAAAPSAGPETVDSGKAPSGAPPCTPASARSSCSDASPGTHDTAIAPPTRAKRKPMRKPPRFDTGMDTNASRIAATPAKTRMCFWNQRLMPRTTSSTPMIRDPAPAVVAIARVR